jgi:hypothetical protein
MSCILPPVGPRAQSFLQQRDRLIGTVRAARIRFGQEDGAEPVGDVETGSSVVVMSSSG